MEQCKIIDLPKISDPRGNLTFIEQLKHIPFIIRRAFWIYDVPSGETRGGHAYKTTHEFIIALSGSFDVLVESRTGKMSFNINRPYFGLYVPSGTWRHMENFSTNTVALILSSSFFSEEDYIRDHDEFLKFIPGSLSESNIDNKRMSLSSNLFKDVKVGDCSLSDLPRIHYRAGNITPVEGLINLPYDIKRVFYLYDIPGGESRGAHAHKKCHQFLIATGGAFDVALDDGRNQRIVSLNRPYFGLHIPPGVWAAEQNFTSGANCLVLASEFFSEEDYLREYNDFLNFKFSNNE